MDVTATRLNGKLAQWNGGQGFGFVVADGEDEEIFVHITAFPRGGRPPTVGQALSFELQEDGDGRKLAIHVRRPDEPAPGTPERRASDRRRRRSQRRRSTSDSSASVGAFVVGVLLVAGLGWGIYLRFPAHREGWLAAPSLLSTMPPAQQAVPATYSADFQCDGRRYCSQMTSCDEAHLFLKHCPDNELDGNGNGIPCEHLWCKESGGG